MSDQQLDTIGQCRVLEIEDPDTLRVERRSDAVGVAMTRLIQAMAVAVLVVSACGGSDAAPEPSTELTSSTAASLPAPTPTTLAEATEPSTSTTVVVTTTDDLATTSTVTTTEAPIEVNAPDVEAWWCDAFDRAGDQSPEDFALGLSDDVRHGYSDMPAETLEDGAAQAALVQCDPGYGQAVAEALGIS